MRGWHGVLLTMSVVACTSGEVPRAESASPETRPAPLVVDSARSMPEMIARFQSGLQPVSSLQDASRSQAALVRRFVAAQARNDTAALEEMVISRSEFAFVYFPESALAAPPYEMDPALAWFQMQLENERGIRQGLRALGGQWLEYRTHECTPSRPERQSRVWRDCLLTWRSAGNVVTQRAFMSIIEHKGAYKFFSYANRLQ